MAYNILGVNPGHNGAIALVSDGETILYIEEERLSRNKYDGNPFRAMMGVLQQYPIDEIVIAGTTNNLPQLPWTGENPYTALVRKYYPKVKTTLLGHEHHYGHAATAFFNSGFETAAAVIVDGAGSYRTEEINENAKAEGFETESIWHCKYPCEFQLVYKVYGNNQGYRVDTESFQFDSAVTITKAYEAVSHYLGFGYIEAGKTMGLAPYGKKDDNIPTLFNGNRAVKDVFLPNYPAGAYIDQARIEYLRQNRDPKEWHKDPSKLSNVEKNLAWQIQHDTQKLVGDLIERAAAQTGEKNIVIAGGYGLNCVANYYFKKRFPELNIYVEPISHDGGTAIGAAKAAWYSSEAGKQDTTIRPQKNIYYGPEYTAEMNWKILTPYEDKDILVHNKTPEDIAQLIADKNIVAIFQGRSEAGPRALGNRSILYDARDPDGKDFVNKVKGREWFRPFAGSVLKEDANEWFDLAGMEDSPYMMYAVNVAADKLSQIPSVTHVDDTCRVQTVSEEDNLHYYNLIKAYKDITGVPVVFNTSFNLAGEPLVENLEDALETLFNSKMKYLYLPELGVLVTKLREDPHEHLEGCEVCDDVVINTEEE